MHNQFTDHSFHTTLLADVFPERLSDDDAMLLFAVLHTHEIHVVAGAISDAPSIRSYAAPTQRYCAACLAHLWRDTTDDRRDHLHWYWTWNTDWSYERVDALDGAGLQRFNEIKRLIEDHPGITSVTPEDF